MAGGSQPQMPNMPNMPQVNFDFAKILKLIDKYTPTMLKSPGKLISMILKYINIGFA